MEIAFGILVGFIAGMLITIAIILEQIRGHLKMIVERLSKSPSKEE